MKDIKIVNFEKNSDNYFVKNHVFSDKAFFSISKPKSKDGVENLKWAEHLVKFLPEFPIFTTKGVDEFIDHIWNDFFENTKNNLKNDAISLNSFEQNGSEASLTSVWVENINNKVITNGFSIGKEIILSFNEATNDLNLHHSSINPFDFLNETKTINWKDEKIDSDNFYFLQDFELKQGESLIVANSFIIEHLILTYLLIKSNETEYWDRLKRKLESNKLLTDQLLHLRGAFKYQNFIDYLHYFEKCLLNNSLPDLLEEQLNYHKKTDFSLIYSRIFFLKDHKNEIDIVDKSEILNYKPTLVVDKKEPIIEDYSSRKIKFKDEKSDIINYCLDNKIFQLYHFTDESNIELIKKMGGLFSWDYLLKKNINIPSPGGDSLSRLLDAKKGLENYVRTSFCKSHPMAFVAKAENRISDLRILEIDPAVMTWENSIFCNMNGTKNGHSRGENFSDLLNIRLDITNSKTPYYKLDEDDKPFYQAEVMVFEHIPLKYILNI